MFLNEEDYGVQVREYELTHITGYSEDIRLKSELMAQQEMESYLRDRYDVGAIFGAVADDRNALIVMYMIDIALYHLFTAVTPRNVPDIRGIRYDAAKAWLMAVAKGTINPSLPPVAPGDDGQTGGTSVWGSSPLPGGTAW